MIRDPDSALVARLHPSPNFEPRKDQRRPDLLLLHYTGMACVERAIDWLARPESKVSCHYVIAEDGTITQMVAEADRAWHAGQSHWAGESDINSCSIGIEIHNCGHSDGYPEFPPAQLLAVEKLSADIVARHAIPRARVLAHSDVAPARKVDPGEKFEWRRLANAGAGLWIAPQPIDADGFSFGLGARTAEIADAQHMLRRFGYGIEVTGVLDEPTQFVLRAFQLHWRPERTDMRLDRSTLLTLRHLLAAAEAEAAVA